MICNLPSEARLKPSLWGTFNVVEADAKLRLNVSGSLETLDPGQQLDQKSSANDE